MPRKYTLRQRWADYRADARANRPKGVKARVRAWLHVEPFYWGMRRRLRDPLRWGSLRRLHQRGCQRLVATRGVTSQALLPRRPPRSLHRWHRVPPKPRCRAATRSDPTAVLVRPAEHAASTYTKPELPEEAKENTERGAELAAEYLLDTLTYAWNTGDTQPFENMTEPGEKIPRRPHQECQRSLRKWLDVRQHDNRDKHSISIASI